MLVPVSPDQVNTANLPPGAVYVQLARNDTQGPVTVTPIDLRQLTSSTSQKGTKWAEPNPAPVKVQSVVAVQPTQSVLKVTPFTQPVQPILPNSAEVTMPN